MPTHRLSYRGSSKNLNSIARPYDERAFSQLDFTAVWLSHHNIHIRIHTYMHTHTTHIHMFVDKGKRVLNREETSGLPLLNAGFELRMSRTGSPTYWMPADIHTFCLCWFWCTGTGKHIYIRKGTDKLSCSRADLNPQPSTLWQRRLAAGCPERLLHATEIAPKKAIPDGMASLLRTTDYTCEMNRPIQRCSPTNLELCPGAGDMHLLVLILMHWHRETHIYPQRNHTYMHACNIWIWHSLQAVH